MDVNKLERRKIERNPRIENKIIECENIQGKLIRMCLEIFSNQT